MSIFNMSSQEKNLVRSILAYRQKFGTLVFNWNAIFKLQKT